LASNQGADVILSNVGQVLGTKLWSLPWRTELGSSLEPLRHRANTPVLRDLAAVYVREALARWEPRVHLKTIDAVTPGKDDQNQVTLRATVGIEGEQGERQLETKLRMLDGLQVPPEQLAYSITSNARVARGLGFLAEPPPHSEAPASTLLGTGMMRPIYRGRDFSHGAGAPEIMSNVGQVLGTQVGTLPWRPELGSRLHLLRHRPNNHATRELARLYVDEALSKWEPRAEAAKVEVVDQDQSAKSTVAIRALCRISLTQESAERLFAVEVK
jgi:phage baseplate assembly protein W